MVGLTASFAAVQAAHADSGRAWDGQSFVETAPASGGVSLPSDLGVVSIDASRRAINADITDWSDDRDGIKTRRVLACALAGAESGILQAALTTSVPTLALVVTLDQYLGSNPTTPGASLPLYTPLSDLSKVVNFTAPEQQALARLMKREVQDLSDRIRLAIDTQSFLMKVSARLYDDQINYHFKRTEGFMGFFRADPEYCAAFSLRIERDANLINAANKVLVLYGFLEKELQN